MRPPHDDDPGALLELHRAPEGLLERALAAPEPAARRSARSWAVPAAAMAATFLLGMFAGRLSEAPQPAAVTVAEAPTQDGLVMVTLSLHAPDATTVHVAGSWNDWTPTMTSLTRGQDGTFVTMIALPRGVHEYMFVIDGERWVTDPAAAMTRDDGFGGRNGVLRV